MAAMGHRRVAFDVPQPGAYAVQLRLTPALLEALLRAQEEGQGASIRFGDESQSNAIIIGDAAFRFNALPEESCDLLQMPTPAAAKVTAASGGGGPAAVVVGAVRQKLMVQRNIADERERVRARAEEAERRGSERKAQLLDRKPSQAGRKAGTTHTTTAAAAATAPRRGITPPPTQLTASMLAAPAAAARPPAHPGTARRARSATPPPAAAPAVASAAAAPAAAPGGKGSMHKSASAGKLGLGGKQGSSASLAAGSAAAATPLVLSAARSGASLRLCLIAMLSERNMPMSTIKGVLADVAARVRSFKAPKKDELERAVKAVSEHKSPGVYVLYEMLKRELDVLLPAGSDQQASPPSGHSGEATATGGAAPRGRQKQQKQKAAAAATAGDTVRKTAAAGAGAGGKKRNRLDWTDDDSDPEPPLAAPQLRVKLTQQYATQPPASTSPPSISRGGGGGGGSSSSGAGTVHGGRPPRRSSSSRGSEHADESWIEEHADRQPEPAAPITSKEEYHQREAAFNARYTAYFNLHQLIEAHKKDVEALVAAAASAATPSERERHRAELDLLLQRRGERAKRWDAAYRVLHQELAAAKARMAQFVQQLQRQQQQQQQQQQKPGGVPVVRVK